MKKEEEEEKCAGNQTHDFCNMRHVLNRCIAVIQQLPRVVGRPKAWIVLETNCKWTTKLARFCTVQMSSVSIKLAYSGRAFTHAVLNGELRSWF